MNTKRISKKQIILIVSSVITATLLLVALVCGMFARAWFRDYLDVTTPAKISNFDISVEYSIDGTWKTLKNPEAPIELTSSNDVNSLQVRITYQGFSAAYLRTKVYGNFYNKHTGTHLPQPEHFWTLSPVSASDWKQSGDYWYHTSLLHNLDQSKSNDKTPLSVLNVSADMSALGEISPHQEYAGNVYVVVDVVQPDRCEAFWGVSPTVFEE